MRSVDILDDIVICEDVLTPDSTHTPALYGVTDSAEFVIRTRRFLSLNLIVVMLDALATYIIELPEEAYGT